jgi:hypothetical protein
MSFVLHQVRGNLEPGAEIAGTALMQYVEGEGLLIGRGAGAQLRFEEAAVALEHARLELREGRLELADLGSLTGTYVNGKRVERATLVDRDWIEIGRHRLTVRIESMEMPVAIYMQELAAERAAPAAGGQPSGKLEAPRIDYEAALTLRRPGLGPATLSYLAVLLVGAGLALAAWSGHRELFRPGPLSDAHTPLANRCAACHSPWHGPDDTRCATCHAGPEHQPRQATTPSCTSCHREHSFQPRLALVDDRKCVDCHRELRLAKGAPPRFAHRVTDFATDHPQFALTAGDGTRRSLDQPGGRRGDSAVLAFDHALHLRADLKSPRGPVQLDCFACHSPTARTGEIAPVDFERNCQGCHRLVFDPRFPDAPHERPEVVHAFLLRAYAERQEQMRPLPELRRLLPGRAFAAPPPVLRLDERVLRQVVEAEINLYRAACNKCHEIDLAGTLPAVTEPAIPTRWLVYARFPHGRHRGVRCTACHAGAAQSRDTADVLLPGIGVCRNCHGPQQRAVGVVAGATTRCISCHDYHDKSRTGEWGRTGPSGVWETESGLASPPIPSAPHE